MKRPAFLLCGAALALFAGAAVAFEQQGGKLLAGAAAYGDWRDDAPGVRRRITPSDLPAPLATQPVASRSKVVKRPQGASPKVPEGFTAKVFAEGLKEPRAIRSAPNGDIFVSESGGGQIRVLRPGKDGLPAQSEIFAGGLERPYGIAFYPPGADPRYVYVATPGKVVRYPYKSGDLKASGQLEHVVDDLPGEGGHWTRDIAFSPDGATLYVSVGSKSNVAEGQPQPSPADRAALEKSNGIGASGGSELYRADVLAFDPYGGHRRVYATGLRNCSGVTIRPSSDELWCAVNERDMLGDNLPPDYATHVKQGAFYGWPWYYIGDHEDPRHAGQRPDLAGKVTVPEVLIQPHSAPLAIAFYAGAQFPKDYVGDAFVTLHGSWNRSKRTGYKVIRLRFANGEPTGEYDDFLTGFVVPDHEDQVWGRPVGVTVAADGALLVTEDGDNTIWRISYGRE